MRQLTDAWRRHYEATLLGRLRLGLFAQATGSDDASPEPHEVRLFLMSMLRSHVRFGKAYRTLFHLDNSRGTGWDRLEPPMDFRWVLHKLERQPYREAVFIEITGCPAPWPDILGVLIRCESLSAGGYVYSLLYLDDRCARRPGMLGYAEVRARGQDTQVVVSVLRENGYVHHTDFAADPHADLATRLLAFLGENNRFRSLAEVPASATSPDAGLDGADDPVFMELVQGVYLGQGGCSELTVPLNRVKPHDPAFALGYPRDFMGPVLAEIHAGNRLAMAVYWRDDRFVMCDDYPVYMAYRELRDDRVPVVVLGEYPGEFGPATRTGGAELLPSVMVADAPPVLDDETMDLVLEARLQGQNAPPGPLELYALHQRLCELLADRRTTERHIHGFVARFPVVLDAYGASVRSEVRLGRRYRVDLVLQYPTSDRRVLLVELEAPSKALFTRAGRVQAQITHALQQVEDWLRWWMENPSAIPDGLERGVQPDGLVVVGRSVTLTADEKQRLVHLNQNRKVKLITYDDLLDRLEDMIRNLEVR